jgi:ribonuclease P protein component
MGLPRHLRLRAPEDFARMRQQGRAYRHRLLLLSTLPNALPHNRYGIITPKRLGGAVQRNQVRRLLREVLRHKHPVLRGGFDLVIVAHPPLLGQPLAALESAFDELAAQAKLKLPAAQGEAEAEAQTRPNPPIE